ncbi:hypothetical protein [Domibacillus tundrae]|uniref:hypothetical protein n=1 Tax=Domibacillus tundrae TaxID=1587527 RepID=UPI00339AF11F
MANRPTMSKLQKELQQVKSEFKQFKVQTEEKQKAQENQIKDINRREIISMLQKTLPHNPSRPFYTYDEIAKQMNCSSTSIANIAKEAGISRRDKRVQ